MVRQALIACALVCACSGKDAPGRRDAAPGPVAADAAPAPVLADLPLGLGSADAFAWRKRAGHPAFRLARKAEAKADWAGVTAACKQALAADPTHLEAAWLLAASLGWQGKTDELLAPLQQAVAGDFLRWGNASLELPALAAFRATPMGAVWRARVETDRERVLAAISLATIVTANGDLYAVDAQTPRWYRLTRTNGALVGGVAIPAAKKIAYVARAADKHELALGVVDLSRARTTKPQALGTQGPITVMFAAKPLGFYVETGAPKPVWRKLDDDTKLVALTKPTKLPKFDARKLEVKATSAALSRLPLANATADWDEQGLASALRIAPSNRLVSAPSPGLIDGNTAQWSPNRTHLAFIARLDETCTPHTPSAAAFIAEAATGNITELARATRGIAIDWIGDREVAVSADDGVTIYSLDGAPPRPVVGASGLLVPNKRTKCTEEPAPSDAADADPDLAEDPEPAAVVAPDARLVEPLPAVKPSPP